jgi:hypothetical protein
MPAQDGAGEVFAQVEPAGGKVNLGQRSSRVDAFGPKLEGVGRAGCGGWRALLRLARLPNIFGDGVIAAQNLDRLPEGDAVEELHERDHVAFGVAAAAKKNLLLCIDAEAIVTAAVRTGAAAIDLSDELDPSPPDFVFNAHGAGERDVLGADQGLLAHGVRAL